MQTELRQIPVVDGDDREVGIVFCSKCGHYAFLKDAEHILGIGGKCGKCGVTADKGKLNVFAMPIYALNYQSNIPLTWKG